MFSVVSPIQSVTADGSTSTAYYAISDHQRNLERSLPVRRLYHLLIKNLPEENGVIEFPPLQSAQARGLQGRDFRRPWGESAVHLHEKLNDLSGEASLSAEDLADA